METLFYVVLLLLLVVVFNYFKNSSPELRNEQLRLIRKTMEIAVGFTLTTGKDLIKTAGKAGKAAAASVERNHAEAVKSAAASVDGYVATKSKRNNALEAGVIQSKEFQDHIGLNSVDEYLDSVINPTK